MLVRIENWFTAADRSILRRTASPALHLTEATLAPIALPSFQGSRLVIDVRAIEGDVMVDVGASEKAGDYDPRSGRLLFQGESQRFLVFAESYLVVREWRRS